MLSALLLCHYEPRVTTKQLEAEEEEPLNKCILSARVNACVTEHNVQPFNKMYHRVIKQ